jgi:hypothetical protein
MSEEPEEPPSPHGGLVRCGAEFCVEVLVQGDELHLWLLDLAEGPLADSPTSVETFWEPRPGVGPSALELRRANGHFVTAMPASEETFYRGRTRVVIHRGAGRSEALFVIDELDSDFERGRDY